MKKTENGILYNRIHRHDTNNSMNINNETSKKILKQENEVYI